MMGACMRMGVAVAVGMIAVVAAIPACLLLVWVAIGCMCVLGLLSITKLVLRLMWKPKSSGARKREREVNLKRTLMEKLQDESSDQLRLSLFHQYLDDQLNTLAHHLLHAYRCDSRPYHVDSCDWRAASQVDDQDCLQATQM